MLRRKNRWFFQQMRAEQPSLLERRWKYQQRKSLYGVVRVRRLDGSVELHRSMPGFEMYSFIVRNAAGRIRVRFFEDAPL